MCYCTRTPRNDRSGHARSLHVGTPAHVYTLPTARSPTYARVSCYTAVHARVPYTWAHPPTCAPYTAIRLITSARAPVVILQLECAGNAITTIIFCCNKFKHRKVLCAPDLSSVNKMLRNFLLRTAVCVMNHSHNWKTHHCPCQPGLDK